MFKLIMIEDEKDPRDRLKAMLKKSASHFELVGEYENGTDGLEGILDKEPDLVLTDIKVPYLDGMEVARRARETLPFVKFIIITGFSEFDYAKQAANIGVVSYINKPFTFEELEEALMKAEDELLKEGEVSENINMLNTFYSSNLPTIKEANLNKLISRQNITQSFLDMLARIGLDLDYSYFSLALVDLDEDKMQHEFATEYLSSFLEKELLALSLEGVSADIFLRGERCCLLLKYNCCSLDEVLENFFNKTIVKVKKALGLTISIGLSKKIDSVLQVKNIFQEAETALEYRIFLGSEKAIYFPNIAPNEGERSLSELDFEEFTKLMTFEPMEKIEPFLLSVSERIKEDAATSNFQYVVNTLINVLVNECSDRDALFSFFGDYATICKRVYSEKTSEKVFNVLINMAKAVKDINSSKIVDNIEKNLLLIDKYVLEHYAEEGISLDGLSREINLSISYISALLKKNRNTTFITEVTTRRMVKAQELLKNNQMKISEIAEKLGYSDPYYFSYCFKKYWGKSPKEFRNDEKK